ncbi:hypothetical protein SNE40_001185 [Patella caerulea]|uniref:Uncharacterized protein n=1 Tax=Patella caerulea TaxID=87958 RepID=A0AAN8KDI0_PATCE
MKIFSNKKHEEISSKYSKERLSLDKHITDLEEKTQALYVQEEKYRLLSEHQSKEIDNHNKLLNEKVELINQLTLKYDEQSASHAVMLDELNISKCKNKTLHTEVTQLTNEITTIKQSTNKETNLPQLTTSIKKH